MRPASIERQHGVPALLLIAVAILPYVNGLDGEFTFDDVGVIRDNPLIHQGACWLLFTTVHSPGALYRPLTMLTYVANARIAPSPRAHHAVNVALHAGVTLGVYILATGLLPSSTGATVAATLFAVHPIHTEAVSNIVGRAELLAALFVLITLVLFLRPSEWRAARRRRLGGGGWGSISGAHPSLSYLASLSAFAAALLAKESAFSALGLLAIIVWQRDGKKSRWITLLPHALIGLAYLGIRVIVVGALTLPERAPLLDNPLAHTDAAARIRTAILVLWQYLGLLVAPARLSADYSFDAIPVVEGIGEPRFLVAAAGLVVLALIIAHSARRLPAVTTASLFVIVSLALTANVLFPIGTIKAERLLYLPSVGWCLLCGTLAGAAPHRHARARTIALLTLVGLFAARTWTRNWEWHDNRALFHASVVTSPRSAKAHYNLAVAAQQWGQWQRAMHHYRTALRIYPEYARAAFAIGHLYALAGFDAAALRWYEKALRHDWNLAKSHLQLGTIRQRVGEHAAAESAFRAGLVGEPTNALLLAQLSAALLAQGQRWEAASLLRDLDWLPPQPSDGTVLMQAARREVEIAAR